MPPKQRKQVKNNLCFWQIWVIIFWGSFFLTPWAHSRCHQSQGDGRNWFEFFLPLGPSPNASRSQGQGKLGWENRPIAFERPLFHSFLPTLTGFSLLAGFLRAFLFGPTPRLNATGAREKRETSLTQQAFCHPRPNQGPGGQGKLGWENRLIVFENPYRFWIATFFCSFLLTSSPLRTSLHTTRGQGDKPGGHNRLYRGNRKGASEHICSDFGKVSITDFLASFALPPWNAVSLPPEAQQCPILWHCLVVHNNTNWYWWHDFQYGCWMFHH